MLSLTARNAAQLQDVQQRLAHDMAEFTDGQYDQSIRDRQFLLGLVMEASRSTPAGATRG
jgi:hypothetical protein